VFFLVACTESLSPVAEALASEPMLEVELDPAPPPERAGLTYEIYVRSFYDSDGDGTGDLDGVRLKLDYLESIGVQTLWLMPVFPAFGPAGYDVQDFGSLTPEYGDEAALRALVDEAHARGMRVLLDFPLNHVHREHPWFLAAAEGDSIYRDYFVYGGEGECWWPDAQGGNYYAYFGPDMPDLDWTDDRLAFLMGLLLSQWLEVVDGYRLDAVLMLVEEDGVTEGSTASHALVAGVAQRFPGKFFLAEASEWEVERSTSWLEEAQAVTDFPRREALLLAAAEGDAAHVAEVIAEQGTRAEGMASFLGSHDVDRLASLVADPGQRRALMVANMLLPGNPVIYYGEELDLPNAQTASGQDHAWRAPMPWDGSSQAGFTTGTPWFTPDPSYQRGVNVEAEDQDPGSMLNLVRALACVRAETEGAAASTPVASGSVLRWTRGEVSVEVDFAGSYRVEGSGCSI